MLRSISPLRPAATPGARPLTRNCHLPNVAFRRPAPDRRRDAHPSHRIATAPAKTNGGMGSAMRFEALAATLVGSVVFAVLIPYSIVFIALFALCAILSAIGIWDLLQSK